MLKTGSPNFLLWFSAGSASYFVVEWNAGRSYAPPGR